MGVCNDARLLGLQSRFRADGSIPTSCRFSPSCKQSFSGKRVLFTEFGNPTCPPGTVSPYDRVPLPGDAPPAGRPPRDAAPFACLSEDEMAAYAYARSTGCTRAARSARFGGAGPTTIARSPSFRPSTLAPHELTFGIVRADGTLKPVGDALARLARQRRDVVAAPAPIVEEAAFYATLPDGIFDLYRTYCDAHA